MPAEVFVVAAARTAIGSFGGALKDVALSSLATTALKGAIGQSKVPASAVNHVYMGSVIPTEPRDAFVTTERNIGASRSHSVSYLLQ